ncbi:uncharacterized protein L203_103171 [Cryptococcus depauperatus CBS 7841]|uniref:F-box domain-containing protein n=1 Tax=Cryptococcus depauperatus CBS 7841 TaxID=1295531 RepID=A0AAJ8JT72_9TREE
MSVGTYTSQLSLAPQIGHYVTKPHLLENLGHDLSHATASYAEETTPVIEPGVYTASKWSKKRQMQSQILSLPPGLIQKIISSFNLVDVVSPSRAAQTYRILRAYVYQYPDQTLQFSQRIGQSIDIDWRQQVNFRHFVRRILVDWNHKKWDLAVHTHLDMICDTFLDLYLDLPAI